MPSSDWRKLKDTKSGRSYYFNKKTRKTQWTKPEGFVARAETVGGIFWAKTDPKSKKTYYINSETRETSWSLPKGAKVVPKPSRKKNKSRGPKIVSAARGSVSPVSEKVHVGRDGTIDILEKRKDLNEEVHVRRDGSVDISETNKKIVEDVHIGKDGSVDIRETMRGTGDTISAHVDARGNVEISKNAQDIDVASILKRAGADINRTEHIHIDHRGSIDVRQKSGAEIHVGSGGEIETTKNAALPPVYSFSTDSGMKGISPYDSILMETKSLSSESVALEHECLSLDSELGKFKTGVQGTLDAVKDLLADLDRIERRSSPKKDQSYNYTRRSPQQRVMQIADVPSSKVSSSGPHVHVSRRGSIDISS